MDAAGSRVPGGLTAPEDRRKALEILDAAVAAGARAREAAALLGVGLTTLQRWRRQFAGDGDGLDGRKGSHRLVSHRLTNEERQRILLTSNQPEFAALEDSRPWDATCKVWGCPRPSGLPKYLWAMLEQKLRLIEPLPKAGPAAVTARPRRGLSSQEVTLSGLVPFPAFLAMELIEAHHPHLYRREFGFRA